MAEEPETEVASQNNKGECYAMFGLTDRVLHYPQEGDWMTCRPSLTSHDSVIPTIFDMPDPPPPPNPPPSPSPSPPPAPQSPAALAFERAYWYYLPMFQDEAEQEPYLDPETNVLSAGGGTCAGEGGQEATDFERIVLSVLSDVLQKKEINEQEKYCVQQCFEATYTDAGGKEMPTQGKEGSTKKPKRADAVALEFRPWAKPEDRCKCFYDCPVMGYSVSSLVRPKAKDVVGAGPASWSKGTAADYMMRLHVNCAAEAEGLLSVDFHCNPASYNPWPARMINPPPSPPPFSPGEAPAPPPPPSSPAPSPPPPSAPAVCPSSHPFLEKFGKTDSYFCYERAGNNGKVCGMSNSGIAAPADGTWGADQNDCAGSSLCPSSNPILRKWCNQKTGGCWYFCYDSNNRACGMHNSGIAAPADANWGTDQPNCKGVLCPSSHPFLEKYKPENSYFCYVSAGLSESATGAKLHEVCGMHNSGIAAPADGTWGTNQLDCPGRSLCPSRALDLAWEAGVGKVLATSWRSGVGSFPRELWEGSSARFLETYKYKDSKGNVVDSGKYFCYDKRNNGYPVCGMHNSGIAPPAGGTWGTNQPDCSRAECGWPGISKDDCVAQNCRWDEVGPRKGAATFKCFYVGNTFGKQCSSDMCGDYNKDCCAPGSEPRKCTVPGYKVVAGGISKAASCLKDNGPSGVYQCCKPN